jgi:triosephosphate isomerase (TIM)
MTDTNQRRPLMAGNWKMNLNHLEAIALTQKLAFSLPEKLLGDVEVVVLPPFVDLRSVQTLIDGDKLLIGYGAQDLSPHVNGAYTGDVSGSMLAKLGCQYVVVGHSERRAYHHEDDELVAAKLKAALTNDIAPILCVGEGLDVREAGGHVAHSCAQLDAALKGLKPDQVEKVVVAYEPIWAIGTGKTASPEDAQEMTAALRNRIADKHGNTADRVRILYGGSVKAANIAAIMAQPDVDGALVGGASIDADEFVRICRFREH